MTSRLPGEWDDSFDTPMGETISSRCHKIQRQLAALVAAYEHGIINVSTSVTDFDVRDTLERFMLWVGNLGALQKPESRLSLDSRLAGSTDVREFICNDLKDMFQALTDLTAILDGSHPNRMLLDDDLDPDVLAEIAALDDEPLDEAGSLLQVISECLSSLFKVGILIRQPASNTRDRWDRAMKASSGKDGGGISDKWDIDYVQAKYPKLGRGKLSKRMGTAITKRRRFIAYCRDHAYRLAQAAAAAADGSKDEYDDDRSTLYDDGESRVATSAVQSSKATTFALKKDLAQALREQQRELEEQGDFDDAGSVSNNSVSTTSEEMATLKLPRLTDLSPDDRPFECPICFTLQQFQSEKAWHHHAFKDLKTYLCTLGNGRTCDTLLFEDIPTWFAHELDEHRCSYICLLCVGTRTAGSRSSSGTSKPNKQKLMSPAQLREHIHDFHGEFEKEQLDRFVATGRQPITTLNAGDCPFCDEWSVRLREKHGRGKRYGDEGDLDGDDVVVSVKRFRNHVAMHLEQLAIWPVPHHGIHGDDDDEEGGTDEGFQRGSDFDSDGEDSSDDSGGSDRGERRRRKKAEDEDGQQDATDETGNEVDEEAERIATEKKMAEWKAHLEAAAKLKAELEEIERKKKEKEDEIRRKREEEERRIREAEEAERRRKEEERRKKEEEERTKKEAEEALRKKEEDRLRDMLWYV